MNLSLVGLTKERSSKSGAEMKYSSFSKFYQLCLPGQKPKIIIYDGAKDSIYKGNPAASELTNGSIIFYDLFFKEKNKKSILVHESSHHLYKKVAPKNIADFLSMSGWSIEVSADGKVYESPTKKINTTRLSIRKRRRFCQSFRELLPKSQIE